MRERLDRLVALADRHRPLTVLLLIAVALRILIFFAYGPAFYFSDTRGYFEYAERFQPSAIRPYGYSALLNLFQPTGSVWPVIITQNLMGLGCAIAIYALAAAPILFDAYELVLEHYLLADTLFTTLLLLAFVALMWEERLSWRFALAGGVLLAGALLTRTVGTPIVLLVGVYVLIRRVGWRPLLALALGAGIPLVGYLGWFHSSYGVYSFSTWQDRWMYGRVMSIADCPHLELSPETKQLCKRNPDYAYDVDYYVWSHNSPVIKVKRKYIYTFVGEVISQQPGDYSALVGRESWAYFSPGLYLGGDEPRGTTCPGMWRFAQTISEPGCTPRPVSTSRWGDHKGEIPEQWSGPDAAFMFHYGRVVSVPGPVWLACLALIAAAALAPFVRRTPARLRQRLAQGGRARLDALLLGSSGLALIVVAVATSQFDIRYGVPTIALFPLGAALAWLSLRQSFTPETLEPLEAETLAPPTSTPTPDTPVPTAEIQHV
jgi:hypothetical protein